MLQRYTSVDTSSGAPWRGSEGEEDESVRRKFIAYGFITSHHLRAPTTHDSTGQHWNDRSSMPPYCLIASSACHQSIAVRTSQNSARKQAAADGD